MWHRFCVSGHAVAAVNIYIYSDACVRVSMFFTYILYTPQVKAIAFVRPGVVLEPLALAAYLERHSHLRIVGLMRVTEAPQLIYEAL